MMPDRDLAWAVSVAIAASLLLAFMEIPNRSRTPLRPCLSGQSFAYWVVLSFGNAVTTLLASLAVTKMPPSLSEFRWLFCAFFGVFGFEAILKNTNITMFDRGVLTIQDWTEKALNMAAAEAIAGQELLRSRLEARLVARLMALEEEDLNTRILQKTNDAQAVGKLQQSARDSGANSKQYKAFQLAAMLSPNEARNLLDE